jgi:RNA-binding protein
MIRLAPILEFPMSLSKLARSHLRRLSHDLKPVVMIGGKGLSTAVLAELDRALDRHELVKVQLAFDDREARSEAARALAERSSAEIVMQIGKVACLYRRNANEPKINLP